MFFFSRLHFAYIYLQIHVESISSCAASRVGRVRTRTRTLQVTVLVLNALHWTRCPQGQRHNEHLRRGEDTDTLGHVSCPPTGRTTMDRQTGTGCIMILNFMYSGVFLQVILLIQFLSERTNECASTVTHAHELHFHYSPRIMRSDKRKVEIYIYINRQQQIKEMNRAPVTRQHLINRRHFLFTSHWTSDIKNRLSLFDRLFWRSSSSLPHLFFRQVRLSRGNVREFEAFLFTH